MSDDRPKTTIGTLLSLEYGKSLPDRERDGKGHPVFGSNGVVGHHSTPLVTGPGIVVGRKGTAGSVTWSDEDFFPIDTTYWVRLKDPEAVDLRFASLLLESVDLPSICAQTGVPGLNRDRAYEVEVVVSPLSVQRRVVDLIGGFNAQIEALDAEANACAETLACLAAHLLSPLVGTLNLTSVMTEIRSGGTPSRERPDFYGGSVPWLKSGEVASSCIYDTEEKITETAIIESSAWIVPAGSVVVAMYGATAAQVGYLGAPMATNQAVLALVPNQTCCDGRFAYHWFRHHSQRLKAAATGAAQPNLSKAVILREVAYPEVDPEQQAFIGQILDAEARVGDLLMAERDALRAVRATLLSGLLSGTVEIPASYDALLAEAV